LGLIPVMVCQQCHSENSFTAIFCDHCGARLETACPKCGEPNRQGAKFCRNCGQLINHTATVAPVTVPGIPSPEAYVPRHLAEKILATRQSLEGERKEVTVLFADIRGSTRLLEGVDPEDAQKLIDPVLRVMMDAVHRYEGTVNQVLGDGIMALFGAPLAHEDHAVRACYAALAMQEEMRRYRRKLGQSEELGLQIGIGLNSGEVVVRSISNDLNVDYSALGHTTHMAARMQELATGGTILMTAATLREVEGFVQAKSVGAVQAKGVSRPFEAFEVVAATTARTRVQAAAKRGLTPLVGRRTEIEVFSKLVEQAASGKGQILAMVGEPGMGKSRLVDEFARHQLRPGWLVLEGASVSYGKATPYFPLVEMLRHYLQIVDGDGSDNIRDQVVTQILALDNILKDAIPPILSLLGALPDENITPATDEHNGRMHLKDIGEITKHFLSMDPPQRRRHTLDAVKRVLIRESQRQPLLAVFEDLHWVDNETQAFLDSLMESLPMAHILVLVNYRPGYVHTWNDKTYYTQLRVDPLQPTSAEELLLHLLGSNQDLIPLKQLLIHRTEGNPFFAEEGVRSLVETGVLVGEKGAYRPGLKIDEIRIPSTVQNVVADRIDRLPIEEKHLLQMAAVIGVIVPSGLLRAVAGLPEDEIQRYLANLQEAEFLYESALFPELEYTFKHALTNEVAYGALLHDRRVSLHSQILNALEATTGDNVQEVVETLAHHAFQGELWDKAVLYLGQAGTKALACSASREAVLFLERALQALERLPASQRKLERAVDLRLELRNALFLLGESEKLYRYLREAVTLAETLGDQRRIARVLNFLSAYFGIAGDPERAVQSGRRALAITAVYEDLAISAVTNYYLGAAYNKMGDYKQAIEVLKRGMQSVEGKYRHERFGTTLILSVICRSHLVQCLAATGAFNEGVLYGEEGIRIAEEVEHPASLTYMNCSLGVLFLVKGEMAKAISALERSLKFCHSASIPVYIPFVASRLGAAYAASGRVSEGLTYLEQGAGNFAAVGRVGFLSLSMVWLGEGYLVSGRVEESGAFAERALDLSTKHGERGHEGWALKLLGDISLQRKPAKIEEAGDYYRRAYALSHELGMRPLQAHCHVGLSHIYAADERLEQARGELAAAIDLYRSLEMTFWLPGAEAASARLLKN
jgi:class 3 adenylate cyclase/tetratricopeptide (TPR) repeat protein